MQSQNSGSQSPQGLCICCFLCLDHISLGWLKCLPPDTSSDKPVGNICPPGTFMQLASHMALAVTCNHSSHLLFLVCFLQKDASNLSRVLVLVPVLGLSPQLTAPLQCGQVYSWACCPSDAPQCSTHSSHRPSGASGQTPGREEEITDAGAKGSWRPLFHQRGIHGPGGLSRPPETDHSCLIVPSDPLSLGWIK